MRSGFDDLSMVIAVVFLLALVILAGALLVLNLTVRKRDVIHRGYFENDDED